MSRENVEIVRAAADAYNRGDREAALKDAGPNFKWDNSRSISDQGGVYTLDEVRRFWGEFEATWDSFRIEIDEFIDVEEHVVTPFTGHVSGRGGIEIVARGAWVWTIRDGAIARVCLYQERRQALEAVGLSEQDGHADSS
jgi:ketosteroid isomerase-like protein